MTARGQAPVRFETRCFHVKDTWLDSAVVDHISKPIDPEGLVETVLRNTRETSASG